MNWLVQLLLYKPIIDWTQRVTDVIWLIYLLTRWSSHRPTGTAMECVEIHWLLMWSCMIDWAGDLLSKQMHVDGWPDWCTHWLFLWSFVAWMYYLINWLKLYILREWMNDLGREWVGARVTERMNVIDGQTDCSIQRFVIWEINQLTERANVWSDLPSN